VPTTTSGKETPYSVELDHRTTSKRSLRRGTLQFDDETRGEFVFVPEYYNFDTKEGFLKILSAMGIKCPHLILQFEKNHGLIPNTDKDELEAWLEYEEGCNYTDLKRYHKLSHYAFADQSRKDIRAKVLTYKRMTKNFLDGVSEVCHSNDSIYLISEPYRGNELSELACESARRKGVVSLGLFTSEHFSIVVNDESKAKQNKWEWLDSNTDDLSYGEDQILGWSDRNDKQRKYISKAIFDHDSHCVPLGDEARKAIKVSCKLTPYEEAYFEKHRGVTCIANGLANMCSHRLVFSSNKRKNEFKRQFIEYFPTGAIAAGSNRSELYSAIRCLRDGRPLFILKGTGIVARAAEMFISRCNNPEVNLNSLGSELDCYIPITADIIPEAKSLLSTVRSSLPHYSPDTYQCIDLSKDIRMDDMKDRISEVIGTVFDLYPEVGGDEKDAEALRFCDNLSDQVKGAKGRYKFYSIVVQILMRTMILLIVSLATTDFTLNNNNNQVDTADGTDAGDGSIGVLQLITLISALIGAALYLIDAYCRPSLKYAALLLAESRLESETFRFKTRTGEYRLLDSSGTKRDIRAIFTKNSQRLFDECVQSDFAHASLKPLWPYGKKDKAEENVVKRSRGIPRGIDSYDSSSFHMSTPSSSYELESGSSKSKPVSSKDMQKFSSKDIQKIDSALSSKSTSSSFFPPSQRDLSSIQCLSYSDRCLSFDDFIMKRLQPALQESEHNLPLYTFFKNMTHLVVIGLTSGCALLVIFGQIQWIPLALAGASSAEFILHFFHLTTRVSVLNVSTRELRQVNTWEQGLNAIQTRLPSKKNELVDRCENAILSSYDYLAFSNITKNRNRGNYENESIQALNSESS